ncbi:putative mannose-6-phosphate isomerase [Schistosoma japonicum]|nr:putative mannose-6-phosphate isomerase [Schistosoma japonicum]
MAENWKLLFSPDNKVIYLEDLFIASSCCPTFDVFISLKFKKISDLVETLKRRLTNGEKIIIPPVKNHILDTEVLGNVFVRLATDYPGDVGCFSLFFFNYIKLNPGEAIFLEPNLPHAYLFGDCVECMASSDNVIRAGLTPKFKDVDHLLRIIQYEPRWGSALKFAGQRKTIEPIDSCIIASNDNVPEKSKVQDDALVVSEIVTFSPPVDDFAVDRISHKTVQFPPLKSASILIIIHGKGTLQRLHLDVLRTSAFICESVEFDEGSVFFISAGVSFCIHQFLQESNSYILAFRAYANVSTD